MVFIFTNTSTMRWLSVVLAVMCLGVAGCSTSTPTDQVEVLAAAYPFAWLAEQVGGPDVRVTNLVKPGAEPHDIELSPRQVVQVRAADLVVYLDGFQAAVDDALEAGDQGLDLGRVVKRQGHDPHVWLDPIRMQQAAMAIGARLERVDARHAAAYRTRAMGVVAKLDDLDQAFRTALKSCERHEIVTSHSAFGYLASRYGLTQHGISGLSPDAEPSPGKMAEVAGFAREHHVTTIFFESLVDPKVAKTVAGEIGASTAVLDPIEGVTDGNDYLSVQLRNATALRRALGCV